MKSLLYKLLPLTFVFLLTLSCQEEEDPDLQEFEVSMNPVTEAISVIESGRTESDPVVLTDLYFELFDDECNHVDTESRMFSEGVIDPIILPNLSAGKYHYSLRITGEQSITFDSVSHFTISSDTILEAHLNNKQMRYRFEETSNFTDPDVHRVTYLLNYSSSYWWEHFVCNETGNWFNDEFDGFLSETVYSPDFNTSFGYQSPRELESVQVKFYNSNNSLIRSTIIPLVKSLELNHSYTFQINLSSIWSSDPNGSSIKVNLEEVSWEEEVIEVN